MWSRSAVDNGEKSSSDAKEDFGETSGFSGGDYQNDRMEIPMTNSVDVVVSDP